MMPVVVGEEAWLCARTETPAGTAARPPVASMMWMCLEMFLSNIRNITVLASLFPYLRFLETHVYNHQKFRVFPELTSRYGSPGSPRGTAKASPRAFVHGVHTCRPRQMGRRSLLLGRISRIQTLAYGVQLVSNIFT